MKPFCLRIVVKMNSRERYEAAMRLEEPDKIPILSVASWCANLIGAKMPELMTNGEIWAKAQLVALQRFGCDALMGHSDAALEAQAMGAKTKLLEWQIPSSEPMVNNLDDLEKLEVPDPKNTGRLPAALKSLEVLSEKVGNRVYVIGGCNAPLTMAGTLMGIDLLMISMIKNPNFVKRCLDFCLEHTVEWTRAQIDAGADQIMTFDPVATGDLISSKHYREYALPYAKKQSEIIKEYGGKFAHHYHICGYTNDRLHEITETGAVVVSLDEKVDIGFAKQEIGHKICIAGNVNPNTILSGTLQQVERETRECIKKAARGGGYVLWPGCDIGLDCPLENVERMVKVGKEYTYPLL